MKNVNFKIVLIVLLFFPIMLKSQESPADELFDKYSGKDGFTSVYITQHMFSLFANVETEEDESGFIDLVKNLNCIKILSTEDDSDNINVNVNFYKEIMETFPGSEYEELMIVKKKDQDVKFLIRKKKGKIRELLMISGGKGENALISIQGDIDLKTISKLSKTMNIEGIKDLEKIDKIQDK
ncbi:MAG: DUF4252 domain-containing protein [Bacteroidales bacterium]|nr:DUF4252 domain-containing protein [Bacteroidales bacterium]